MFRVWAYRVQLHLVLHVTVMKLFQGFQLVYVPEIIHPSTIVSTHLHYRIAAFYNAEIFYIAIVSFIC